MAWPVSVSLLPLALSLACSNEAPPQDTASSSTSVLDDSTSEPSPPGDTSTSSATLPTTTESSADDTAGTTFPSTTSTIGGTTDNTSGVEGLTTTTGETTADSSSGETSSGESSSTGEPAPDCADGLQNGLETDIDCGGECDACDDGQMCLVPDDCQSGVCPAGTCSAASCSDAVQNQDETDIDCGGDTCPKCLDGDSCIDSGDCDSGVCDGDICVAPSCNDNAMNQDETDVDCGGAICGPCDDGESCALPADCVSGVCTADVCTAATCFDVVQNQDETAIDCGGAVCAPCQLAGLILNEVDYDNVGTDSVEFVEIYNNTGAAVSLVGINLVLINGATNAVYLDLSLAGPGVIEQGQYLVVANANFVVPPGALKVEFVKISDNLQNDMEGVALLDKTNMVLLDALSYEGQVTMANLPGLGPTSLVEGAPFPGVDSNTEIRSLVRFPDGNDKNDAATDWALSKSPTPGAANLK